MVKKNSQRSKEYEESLTEMKEDYIRTIYVLRDRNKQDPKVTEIAKYLKQKKSTVSEALKTLHDQGLVYKERYKPIILTERGLKLALKLTWKHRLIELFLYNVLDFSLEDLHQEAHKLEHATSDILADKLHEFITNPEQSKKKLEMINKVEILTCPHGQPLPDKKDFFE